MIAPYHLLLRLGPNIARLIRYGLAGDFYHILRMRRSLGRPGDLVTVLRLLDDYVRCHVGEQP